MGKYFLSCCVLAFLLGRAAGASGITLHMFMSDEAAKKVGDSNVRAFLEKHQNKIRSGAMFPDSGYVAKNSYGEFAHWDGFHNGYSLYLDQLCSWPLSSQCETLFAFFLGTLSHAVSDVSYHRYFVRELADRDFNGSYS